METGSTERVLEIAREFDAQAEFASPLRDVFADSLDYLDFLQQAEHATGATLSNAEVLGLTTIQTLTNALRARIQVESWSDCVEEMETLFPLHWKELGRFQEQIPMQCDRARYAALEKAGALLLITARIPQPSCICECASLDVVNYRLSRNPDCSRCGEDGFVRRLIGYFVGFLFPHPHYFGSGLWGMTDMYFVLPEFRNGVGVRLFVAFENELRARGCVQAVTSCKLHEDHTALLEKLGWTWTDKTFQKHLTEKAGKP
jgi:hypothetical protein